MPSAIYPAGSGFKIDGVHSDTWQMYLRNWTPQNQPTVRGSAQDIPGRAGKYGATALELSSRLLTMDVGIYGVSVQVARDKLEAFSAALNPETGPHKLLLEDHVPNRTLWVVPSALSGTTANVTWSQISAGHCTFITQLEALDPHWYFITPQSFPSWQPRSTLASRQITLPNSGNRSTPPLWTIAYPSASNIGVLTGIKLAYAGSSFQYDGSLTVGDVLTVNCDPDQFSVLKNGVSDIANWHGDDFPALPGTTTGLASGTPPLAAPVNTVVTWTDTNTIGANVGVSYLERSV